MGTSSPYGGPGGSSPLIPSWLESTAQSSDGSKPESILNPTTEVSANDASSERSDSVTPVPQPAVLDPKRFNTARNNFSRFAASGGGNKPAMRRALSSYVRKTLKGSRLAARRMSTSRVVGRQLIGILSDVATRGSKEVLKALKLDALIGKSIDDILLGLADFICPEEGNIDAGIARHALLETISEVLEGGSIELESITEDQISAVFEIYVTNTIEARLYNDIGTKAVSLPPGISDVIEVDKQIRDFIQYSVAEAIRTTNDKSLPMTSDSIGKFVDEVYEKTYDFIQEFADNKIVV